MNALLFIKTVLKILPFFLLCLLNRKINLNKANRGRQFLMPVIAFLYSILGVVFLERINALLIQLINWASAYIPQLSKIAVEAALPYIFNTALILVFILIKTVLLPVLNGIWRSDRLMEFTVGWCYEKEEDVDRWLLKRKYANLRGYYRGIYCAFLTAVMVVFVLSQNFTQSVFFQAVFYPVFGILVLSEVVSFLAGMTKTEFVENILGEDEESYKVSNYGILREILRDLFGDRVLYDGNGITDDGVSSAFDELEEMAESTDATEKQIGAYFRKLRAAGEDVDINYVKSCRNLVEGRSTLFCNPFYRDLTRYIILPMVKQLIAYRKCLVVLGRDSALDDVEGWLTDGFSSFAGTDSLWQIKVLGEQSVSTDVGILRFSDIHNLKLHRSNRDFLSQVGFLLLLEPSRILASGQIGLSLLVSDCESSGKEIVCCACDRNCDGLVDALSHILKTTITEVTATLSGSANSSQMYWNGDGPYMHHKLFPNVSRYLGVGTEINAVALKYQIGKTAWIGSEKFPVADMKWIAGQYYRQICDYADLPVSQSAFDRAFEVTANLWNGSRQENTFLVVEDEYQNLFEMARVFQSRAKNQGFVNVISENYLLRDYMLDNKEIFLADPKAIPTIVPDFARTERNMVLKLIMMMVNETVSEERLGKELMLCGIPYEDPYVTFKELILKHCDVSDATLSVRFKEEICQDSLYSNTAKYYEINETNELYAYAQFLKNAYYIAEDEEGDSHYIGSKLYGHIFQALLPGQFMTFDGKYYEVHTITPQNGVVVRRAADHITGRRYYRQIRTIHLTGWTESSEMGSKRATDDLEIVRGYAELSVETEGYLEMDSYGDLARARRVLLNGIPIRNYHNKSVLRVKLPGASDRSRSTICLLLNEIFRTTYPETYHYIAAVCPEEKRSDRLKYISYAFDGECETESFYVIEDSDIDLGLIVSVERNMKRYLEIAAEILNWHTARMLKQPEPEESGEKFVPEFPEKEPKKRKGLRGIIDKIGDFFKKLFGRKKKKPEEESKEVPETVPEEEPKENLDVLAENDIGGEDEEVMEKAGEKTAYQKNCFLAFGFEEIDESLDIDGTRDYLNGLGLDKSPLQQARVGSKGTDGEAYDPHKYGAHLCDFCGVELLGGEYEVLKDGRERCNRCSMTAVKTVEEFRELYRTVVRNMETFYGIKLNVAVKVRMTNAKQIAKHTGVKFTPTPGFDGRVLGFARRDKTGYSLYMENGAPKLAATATIAHELTHIWQYLNWNDKELIKLYGKENMLEVYEGMAKWAEIQYLMLLNETAYAKRQEITTRLRDDEYGRGFILYAEKYPLTCGTSVARTPFKENPPL